MKNQTSEYPISKYSSRKESQTPFCNQKNKKPNEKTNKKPTTTFNIDKTQWDSDEVNLISNNLFLLYRER